MRTLQLTHLVIAAHLPIPRPSRVKVLDAITMSRIRVDDALPRFDKVHNLIQETERTWDALDKVPLPLRFVTYRRLYGL